MLNKDKFSNLISSIAELYKQDLSSMVISFYYNVLKDYSYEQIEKAFNIVARTFKYNCMPKPAEIIEAIEGKEDERAILAWQSVIDAIRKYDYYYSIEFEDKIIHLCIEHFGGWMWLCEQTIDDMRFIEKDFIRLYRTFEKNPRIPNKKLIGYFEQINAGKGKLEDIPETIFIPLAKSKDLITFKNNR